MTIAFKPPLVRLWLTGLVLILIPAAAAGAGPEIFAVGRFSEMAPGGSIPHWQPLTFRNIASATRYALVKAENGATVLRADSRASASGLVRKVSLRAGDYPWITWRWKVGNTLEKGDIGKKSGDDYAARIYITFAEAPEDLSFLERTKLAAIKLFYGEAPPAAALSYVWSNRAAVGSIHPNAYTDRVQMIVVESGPAHADQWRQARRNILEDFRLAFGTDPPPISAVAVMTDTDNTGEAATAWYGDIILEGPQ